MSRFAIVRADSFARAAELVRDGGYRLPVIKAGGMDVVDHLKEGLLDPDALVDVKRVERPTGDPVRATGDGLATTSATTTLAELAESRTLARHAPVLAQAAGDAATPQVRNVATIAGNLLQRPRCWYYRQAQFDCLKKGGHTCYAVEGENAYHAIFGGGPCHIVHPSNVAIALRVCDGGVELAGGDRPRLAVADLYHMPERGLRDEHELAPGEVVTAVRWRAAPTSAFYAIKHKQSFDWPLAAAAVALELDGRRIASARICAGAVAPVPWPLPRVEAALAGTSVDDDDALRAACARASEGAEPLSQNAYKTALLPVAVHRAVRRAAGRDPEPTR